MKNDILLRMSCGVMVCALIGAGLTGCSFGNSSSKNSKSATVSKKETKKNDTSQEKTKSNILPVKISYEYPYRESGEKYVLKGKYPVITLAHSEIDKDGYHSDVADPGYDNVKKELDSINSDTKKRHTSSMDENFPGAASDWQDGITDTPYQIEYSAETKRADDQIISISEMDYYDIGGAHPSTDYKGINIDSKTGKSLVLSDISTDTNKLAQVIADTLKKSYPDIESNIFESTLEKQIKSSCDNDYDKIPFTVSDTGITVMFPAYALTDYAAGPQFADISFSENPDIFNKKYIPEKVNTKYFREIQAGNEININDDGNKKFVWYFAGDNNDVNGKNSLTMTYNGVDYSFEQDGYYSGKCYMTSSGGTTYLYVELSGDNDYRNITIYRIKNGKVNHVDYKADDGSDSDGFLECGFYDDAPYDSDSFIMQKRTDILSTMCVAREYKIGDDGTPVPKTDYYYYNNDVMKTNPVTLTTKTDIAMTKVSSMDGQSDASGKGSDKTTEKSKNKVTIPSGTKYTLFGTDAKTYVVLKSESGKLYRVDIKIGAEGGYCTVDGKNCEDLFDGMFYAG